jgi:hypothetical protein
MLATGIVQPHELADDIERLDDPAFLSATPTMWSVWGQRRE